MRASVVLLGPEDVVSPPPTVHNMVSSPGYSILNGLDMLRILNQKSNKSQEQT